MDQAGGGGGGGEFENPNGDLTMGGSIIRIDVSKVGLSRRRLRPLTVATLALTFHQYAVVSNTVH